jgi:hypothetical protein
VHGMSAPLQGVGQVGGCESAPISLSLGGGGAVHAAAALSTLGIKLIHRAQPAANRLTRLNG